jgi:membrane-bound lytic murein transglycosylase B
MNKITTLASSVLALLFSSQIMAQSINETEGSGALKKTLIEEHGFDKKDIERLFDQAEFRQDTIDLLAKPKEKTHTIKKYKPLFVNAHRLKAGIKFYKANEATFLKVEKDYGIPYEIILSIIGMETNFGSYLGKHRVFEALATLALQHPREKSRVWFSKEFIHYNNIARAQGIDPLSVKGSYTGAMGLPQFMPSSYLGYAVDFEGDGKIDIWNNPNDAIASVANYLLENHWQVGEDILKRAQVTGDYETVRQKGAKMTDTWSTVKKAGWSVTSDNGMEADDKVLPFRIESDKGEEFWLGLKNFYVITRYNHSIRYAMTVWMLGNAIDDAIVEESMTKKAVNHPIIKNEK